jgi:hypothetical protein
VGAEDYGLALLVQFQNHLFEQLGVERVEALKWFVEDEQLWIVHEGGDELRLLLHAPAHRLHLLVRRIGQIHPFQQRPRPRPRCAPRHALEHCQVGQAIHCLELAVQPPFLRQVADAVQSLRRQWLVKDMDATAIGPDDVHQHADGGGFAGAVGAEEAEYLSPAHGQVQVIYCCESVELLGQFVRFNSEHVHSPFLPMI